MKATPGKDSAAGNFIRVAEDGWTFEESLSGTPFIPAGCNYYNADTGWPPRLWSRFDTTALKRDFARMREVGINAIRVWLQWSPFMPERGKLSSRALDQLSALLLMAKGSGIRVNLTGPDFWEGAPSWLSPEITKGTEHIVSPIFQEAHAEFWELLAASVARDETVYAFDLGNEPFVPWDGPRLRLLWKAWVKKHAGSRRTTDPPPNRRIPGSRHLLDYQTFREETAFAWIRRTADAIRKVNTHHLITVGLHQSSCPLEEVIPSRYTAFNPALLKKCIDYVALHWYAFGNPLTASILPYDLPGNAERSLSMFLANCRYCYAGIPLVMEEFSYYGGGSPQFWGGVLPYRTLREQDLFSRRIIAAGEGSLGGWLNWPLQDTRESTDTSAFGGFFTAVGGLKPWGASFRKICSRLKGKRLRRRPPDVMLSLSRAALLTDATKCDATLRRCHDLFREGAVWDFRCNTGTAEE